MKILLDNVLYEFETESLIKILRGDIEKYLTPDTKESEEWATERIAAKMAIRPFLGKVLTPIAHTQGIENWRDIKPEKGDDLLLHIFNEFIKSITIIIERTMLEIEGKSDDKNLSKGNATNSLIITRAIFDTTPAGNYTENASYREWIVDATRE